MGSEMCIRDSVRTREILKKSAVPFRRQKKDGPKRSVPFGAEDEARTRYLHLGKVALYQMSYSRTVPAVFQRLIIITDGTGVVKNFF